MKIDRKLLAVSLQNIHEMLCLFKAGDIHNPYEQRPELKAKARAVFSTSIILNSHRDLNTFMIDQFAASCIGWIKSYWDWYEYHMPSIDEKSKDLMKLLGPKN